MMRFFYSLKLEKNEYVPFVKDIYLFLIFKSNSKSLIKRIKLKNTIFTKKKIAHKNITPIRFDVAA
jgi:hypothetical protein|tara:strand:- start:59 stop:256 length:198 start_codon:yes stop_codon:yes gene_type:complete